MAMAWTEYRVIYSDHQGTPHEAIQLPWSVVEEIVGPGFDGDPEDEQRLINALLASGAPEWVRTAGGWVDEHGWGLIGPEVAGAGEDSITLTSPHSGATVTITEDEVTGERLEALAVLMDDEIREAVHSDLAPCTPWEFWREYVRRAGGEHAAAIWFS